MKRITPRYQATYDKSKTYAELERTAFFAIVALAGERVRIAAQITGNAESVFAREHETRWVPEVLASLTEQFPHSRCAIVQLDEGEILK